MHSLFFILFLIAPLVSPGQARGQENLQRKGASQGTFKPVNNSQGKQAQSWVLTSELEPLVIMALTQSLSVLTGANEEFKALADGVVPIKFQKLPKDHFAAIDPYYPNEVQVNRENFEKTMKELGGIGSFDDEALGLAAFLWAPSLAHEISHSLNFARLIELTGLKPAPYVLEEEMRAHVVRAQAVADVVKSHVSEEIMWQTTIGQFNLYRLKDLGRGPRYLRETVVALYADLPSVFESNPEETQTLMRHKFLMAAAMAEARGTRRAEEDRFAWENQYKFWSSPELIEKVKDFYARQQKREKAFFKTGK